MGDEEQEFVADETSSERSYSSVATEREYTADEILLYLQENFQKWNTRPELSFPDLDGFLKTASKIRRAPASYGFTQQEIHWLNALR